MKIIIFVVVASIYLGSNIDADAFLKPSSNLDLFLDNDVVVVGNIISEKQLPPLPGSHIDRTEYKISVDRYLKSPQSFEKITVEGLGSKNSTYHVTNETIFDSNQKVLLYLFIEGDKYIISPYSATLFGELNENIIPPPLKLFKNGIPAIDIVCKLSFQKIFKHPGIPACVNPESVDGFIERGWFSENLKPNS